MVREEELTIGATCYTYKYFLRLGFKNQLLPCESKLSLFGVSAVQA